MPDYITKNLKHSLRLYQEEAIGRYLYYKSDENRAIPEQVLYNMATGSGKTLLMAAVILEKYQQGERNFIFFVNNDNILTKTKDNFLESSKRNAEDTKVTDALIKYYRDYVAGNDISASQSWIIDRYAAMVSELGLKPAVLEKISKSIRALATLPIEDNEFLYDTFLAAGENNNAKLIAAYFNQNGIDARYVHPREAGIVVTSEPGNARIIPSSYDKIEGLADSNEVLVIPGFFGVTKENQICTFSRGGSDITGSIIAAGVKADLYENFTDVDGIFAAHPGIIHQPHSIPELTYREMRELAYAGFSVLHDEALLPAYRGKIPLVIKNTNNPDHPGTRIVLEHSSDKFPVVGIAGDSGFVSINMSKYLMNREVGFGRKVLQFRLESRTKL